MHVKRLALTMLLMIIGVNISSSISAQTGNDEVTLVVSGEGTTKDSATKVALRSAIEQTFGTFVSSNTQILNDQLVKDEIVSISSGTIKSYDVLSEIEHDGKYNVMLKATVSVSGLVSYAKSKGAKTELAGSTFAMNMKLYELCKKNEMIAFRNLIYQVYELAPSMFDYKITMGSPKKSNSVPDHLRKKEDVYECDAEITITANETFYVVLEMIRNSLIGMSMNESEVNSCREANINYESLVIWPPRVVEYKKKKKENNARTKNGQIYLRNKGLMERAVSVLNTFLTSFEIKTDTYDDFCYLYDGHRGSGFFKSQIKNEPQNPNLRGLGRPDDYYVIVPNIVGIHSSFENPLNKKVIYYDMNVTTDVFGRIKDDRNKSKNWGSPIASSWPRMAQWVVKGHLFFSFTEIEKTKIVEVLPMTVQNLEKRKDRKYWPFI